MKSAEIPLHIPNLKVQATHQNSIALFQQENGVLLHSMLPTLFECCPSFTPLRPFE
jgi:hypothetical protein